MPKQKGAIWSIHSLYKIQALDNIMFGYVLGMRNALPSLSVDRCVDSFMEMLGLSEDDYSKDSAICQFYRYHEIMRDARKENLSTKLAEQ